MKNLKYKDLSRWERIQLSVMLIKSGHAKIENGYTVPAEGHLKRYHAKKKELLWDFQKKREEKELL